MRKQPPFITSFKQPIMELKSEAMGEKFNNINQTKKV